MSFAKDAVNLDIFESSPLLHVLALSAFVLHPDFFQNVTRRNITGEVLSEDPPESQRAEGVIHDRVGCFGAVAVIPVRFPNPIAQLGVFMVGVGDQTNRADEYGVRLEDDGEDDLARLEFLWMTFDPLFSHAV